MSYKILAAPSASTDDWDLLLLVEYPNWAVFDGLSEKMDPITANVSGMNRGEQQQATVERGALREILGSKNAQELTLK